MSDDFALLALAAFCLLLAGAGLHRLISRAQRLNEREAQLLRTALRELRRRNAEDSSP